MAVDTSEVVYTYLPLTYIATTSGDTLQTILGKINTAVNSMSAAPNYSGYNLYCITQVDGSTHPTNTQNFAEGISKIVCDNRDDFDDFVDTTYATAISTLTTSVSGILAPALTYVPFSITSADSLSTVYSKLFTGFTGYNTALNPSGASPTWSTIGLGSPAPTTVTTGFGSLIGYLGTLTTTVSGKQASLGTFNNTTIGGGATDAPITTINLLRTYALTLPEFSAGDITEGCLTAQTDLQDYVQHIADYISSMTIEYVGTAGTGLTYTVGTSCNPASLAINTSYMGLYKVAIDGSDATGDYLENKIVAGTGITLGNTGVQLTITNDAPDTNEVMVNADDPTPGYLSAKLPGSFGNAGLALVPTVSADGTQYLLTPQITDWSAFATQFMNYIGTDPAALAQWCALIDQCEGCLCDAPTGLAVVLDGDEFELTWVVGGTPASQMVKYRMRGNTDWISSSNISPANPQTNIATTANADLSSAPNIVYQFQIDSICSGTSNGSNVYEMILYDCVEPTVSVVARVVNVSQPALITVDQVEYKLVDKSSGTVMQTIVATGINPVSTFAVVAADTYVIRTVYGTQVNGVMLYSSDAGQLTTYCTSADIVIP